MKEELIRKNARKKILVLASTFPRWANDTTPPFVFELEKRLTHDFDIFLSSSCCGFSKERTVGEYTGN